jgi:membrane protease subunit (stomatin/prohibitin family)
LMTTLKSWKFGFNSPFKADVFFVNMRQISNLKWGTPQPVMISDPEFATVALRAFGSFNFRVADPKLFFKEFAGTDSQVTTDEVMDHFRGMINSSFASALKKSGKSIQEINATATELGEVLLPKLQEDFAALGLTLLKFNVESVTLPEEIQRELTAQDMEIRKTRRAGAATNEVELQRQMQTQMLELQKLKAKMDLSQSADDISKFMQMQAALGMEHGGGTGNAAPGMMQQMMEMGMGMNMANQMMKGMTNPLSAPGQQTTQSLSDTPTGPATSHTPTANPGGSPTAMSQEEVMRTLTQLGELQKAGILSDEEFQAKKKELLGRL